MRVTAESLPGVDVHVEERGQGEPVILVHSSGMSSRQWRHLVSVLSTTHRVLVPDLLGYGGTTGWVMREEFDFHEDVELVLAVARAVDRPVHLVGHSYGGLLALTAARALRDVPSIAVYEPVAYGVVFDVGDERAIADLARLPMEFFESEGGGNEDWFRRFVDFWNGDGTWQTLPEAQRASFLAVGRKVFLEVRSLCFDRTPRDAYRDVTAPTLVLHGDRTPFSERRVCEVMAETLPNARLEVIEGVGHMGVIQRADDVSARIVAHVRAAS